MVKLITEINNDDCEVLTESTADGNKKKYYIEGIFMQSDVKNRNGRIYPGAVLEREMLRYDEKYIKTSRALGELNHPEGPQVNPDRASHLITEMRRDGNNFYGKARVLGTPVGKIVQTFIDEGVKVGVSTRGMGSVKLNKSTGIMEVQEDFYLATVDIVTDPSGPQCFVNGIMENTEYFYDIASGNWKVAQMVEETVKELKKEYKRTAPKIDEAKAIHAFNMFLESLK
jgi:hypothetical protein